MQDRDLYTSSEFRDRAIAKIAEGTSRVTDYNPGSVIRALLDAVIFFANYLQSRVKKAYSRFLYTTAKGADLDERVADWGLTRVNDSYARGTVTFMRDTPAPTAFSIPALSLISTQPNDI